MLTPRSNQHSLSLLLAAFLVIAPLFCVSQLSDAAPSGAGNKVVATAVSRFSAAALKKYYSNSSDQYEFSAVDSIVHHKDGRITGDLVTKYKASDLTVGLNVTLDEESLTIRNAGGHVMGVCPVASENSETHQ
jgi:hypothetical protein